jgi:hypothetical protein
MKALPLLAVLAGLFACNGAVATRSPPQEGSDASEDDTYDASSYGSSTEYDAGTSALWPLPVAGADSGASSPNLPVSAGPIPVPPAPSSSPPPGACPSPLSPGDLAIDELMIESVSGTGDYGQWIEVMSLLPCAVNLRALHGDCVNGAKVRTFDVTEDMWIPPLGTFLVADSADPATNHDLPLPLLVWAGQPGDVLRHKGGTIDLLVDGTLIDSLTFPALKLTVGASVEFPADCDLSERTDWTAWQTSVASYFPGFLGTPNAPNTDVTCDVSDESDASTSGDPEGDAGP